MTSMTHLWGHLGCAQRRARPARRGGGGGVSFISSTAVQPHSQGWMNGARLSCVSSTWSAGVPSGVRTITESLRKCINDSIPTVVDRRGIPSTISGLPSLVMMSSPVCGSFFVGRPRAVSGPVPYPSKYRRSRASNNPELLFGLPQRHHGLSSTNPAARASSTNSSTTANMLSMISECSRS